MNFRLILLTGLLLLIAGTAYATSDQILLDDFEDGLKPAWTKKIFQGETRYSVVKSDQGQVLEARSNASASGLVYKIEYDPAEYPILAWRWKVAGIIEQGDALKKSTDDYPARIYVVFPHWFFPKTRTLNYIWANRLPKGTIQVNAFTGNSMMIAVESGVEHVGEWITEQRNIVEDYRRAFGEDPPKVGAIAIMTDTDNTQGRAHAWYDDLKLARKMGDL